MAFENTIGAIQGYNNALKGGQLIDEGHLTYVLQTMFVDIQSAITDGSSSLPTGGTTGQVLAKASNTDADVEWVDASTGGDFLPLAGGIMDNGSEIQLTNGAIRDIAVLTFENGTAILPTNITNIQYWTVFDGVKGFDLINNVYYDDDSSQPLNYSNDYSANYTNRSLVDKEYVDLAIQAAIDALP